MRTGELIDVELPNGRKTRMTVCGDAPPHAGMRTVVATNGIGCFAIHETPRGWVVIAEPVKLYPV